jgi:hypothetical protein
MKIVLNCGWPAELGGERGVGELNVCPHIHEVFGSPLSAFIGDEIELSALDLDVEGDEISHARTAIGGRLLDGDARETTFTCEVAGEHGMTLTAAADDDELCLAYLTFSVTCQMGGAAECPAPSDFPNGVAAAGHAREREPLRMDRVQHQREVAEADGDDLGDSIRPQHEQDERETRDRGVGRLGCGDRRRPRLDPRRARRSSGAGSDETAPSRNR